MNLIKIKARCEHACEVKKGSNSFRVLIIFYDKSDQVKKRLDFGNNISSSKELHVYIDESEFNQRNFLPSIENANLISLDFIKNYYNSTGVEGYRTLEKINFESVVLKVGRKLFNEILK